MLELRADPYVPHHDAGASGSVTGGRAIRIRSARRIQTSSVECSGAASTTSARIRTGNFCVWRNNSFALDPSRNLRVAPQVGFIPALALVSLSLQHAHRPRMGASVGRVNNRRAGRLRPGYAGLCGKICNDTCLNRRKREIRAAL